MGSAALADAEARHRHATELLQQEQSRASQLAAEAERVRAELSAAYEELNAHAQVSLRDR